MLRPRSSTSNNPNANARAAEPVADDELDTLFSSFAGRHKIALAVSGGPDSVALLHLALSWRAHLAVRGPDFVVLTVDHALRPESAAEAAKVAGDAAMFGLEAHVLTRMATAAHTGLLERARTDRYRLLARACAGAGADALATGHTLHDQAETLLMRLARGSGIDGLSAMAPVGRLGSLALLRPLLGLPKARLEASLRARGVGWVVDPSNANPDFERPRLRALQPLLTDAGLGPLALASSARRLARARAALEHATDQAMLRLVSSHAEGYFAVDRVGYDALPEDIRLRLLGRLVVRIGTHGQAERLARLERLVAELAGAPLPAASLGGCLVLTEPDRLLVVREPGRKGLPKLLLCPGEGALWDHRCGIEIAPGAPGSVTIRGLETEDFHGSLAAAARASGLPRAVLQASASAWDGGTLLALPALAVRSPWVKFVHRLDVPLSTGGQNQDFATPHQS